MTNVPISTIKNLLKIGTIYSSNALNIKDYKKWLKIGTIHSSNELGILDDKKKKV
jgi:hypothetical protein